MITRCPECGTKFRISIDLIRAEDSTVRCGDCMTVFDARSQLVDEAAESSYVADSARERAARLRHEQHQASRQRSTEGSIDGSIDDVPYDARGNARGNALRNSDSHRQDQHTGSNGHGEGWVSPGWDNKQERSNRHPAAERPVGGTSPHPHGQLLIDRRESETDIDLDHADTIAYQPVNQFAEEAHSQVRATVGQVNTEQTSPDLELAELDKAQREQDAPVINDYSRRIDPLINPDDKSIEFERTLALEGLTGIESAYHEAGQGVPRRSAVERSIETESETASAVTNQSSSYVGEHQFDSRTRNPDYGADLESRAPQGGIRTRPEFHNDPDVVNRPIGPPRSERHLDEHLQSNNRDASGGDVYDRASGYETRDGESRGNQISSDQGHYSVERPGDAPDPSESAIAMRQHLNERGVEIESDDEYEYVQESRSSSVGWWLLGLLAVACAAAFYARDDIAKSNLPQSVRAGFCTVAGCELPVASNIADLELLRQKVYSHPSNEDALVVSIDVLNNAVFPQPYPVLSVTMANSSGESVAQRDFVPADYLENYAGTETLAPGKPTRINIEIVDPGDDAQSFEMEFRQL